MNKLPLFKVNMNQQALVDLAPVFSSGYIGEGPKVKEFEEEFYKINSGLPVKPLFVNSCTSAIVMALKLAGVGPGDEVISTPETCSASNTAVLQHYAKVVWADVDPLTGLIDPEDVKKKITAKTKAIIGVDWGGRHCDYNKLKSYGLPVIQDAAHCLYVDSNNHGTYVCWSFGAIKFLCTVDGGALMVPETQYEEARLLRWFGLDREGSASFRCAQDIKIPGSKFQQNDVSATIGLANIPNAKTAVAASRENAREYYLSITNPKLQLIPFDNKSNYWIYTLLTKDPLDRDRLIGYLAERGIESSQVHARNDKHTVFKESKTYLPNTALFDSSQLAIPNGFWITEKDRMYIVDTLNNFN